ncbi:hypothetical protein [Deinococcus aluminii]|uniref:Uncharacterized protein n=1 Tax=Deinococcus aluminii TaxID=1656885 RepID=A0ABP9XH32_9DEIO
MVLSPKPEPLPCPSDLDCPLIGDLDGTRIPSGTHDQFHDAAGKTRSVVWRACSGLVRNVSTVRYGHQPLTQQDLAVTLLRSPQARPVALVELNGADNTWDWGHVRIVREDSLLPGTRVGIVMLGAAVKP